MNIEKIVEENIKSDNKQIISQKNIGFLERKLLLKEPSKTRKIIAIFSVAIMMTIVWWGWASKIVTADDIEVDGDWNIDNLLTEDEVNKMSDRDNGYIIGDDIIVKDGGKLTLIGLFLKFNASCGIKVEANGILNIDKCIMTKNQDSKWDGIRIESDYTNITFSTILYSETAIDIQYTTPQITNNTIANNTIGLNCIGSFSTISDCKISNNIVGIICEAVPDGFSLFNTVIESNIYGLNSTIGSFVELINCKVFGSEIHDFYIDGASQIDILDSIIYGNKIYFVDPVSSLKLYRNLKIRVAEYDDSSQIGAVVDIFNNAEVPIWSDTTDNNGTVSTALLVCTYDFTGCLNETPHRISAQLGTSNSNKFKFEDGVGLKNITIYIGNDADNDGLTDGEEKYLYMTDYQNNDTDSDGLLDGLEVGIINITKPSQTTNPDLYDLHPESKTNPLSNDTDNDGLNDSLEDVNKNGLYEAESHSANDYETDPNNPDTDNDGILDGKEGWGIQNWSDDCDEDGYINARDVDSDNDGLYDGTEDADRNGLFEEKIGELNPLLNDTDGDNLTDDEDTTVKTFNLTKIELDIDDEVNQTIRILNPLYSTINGPLLENSESLYYNYTNFLYDEGIKSRIPGPQGEEVYNPLYDGQIPLWDTGIDLDTLFEKYQNFLENRSIPKYIDISYGDFYVKINNRLRFPSIGTWNISVNSTKYIDNITISKTYSNEVNVSVFVEIWQDQLFGSDDNIEEQFTDIEIGSFNFTDNGTSNLTVNNSQVAITLHCCDYDYSALEGVDYDNNGITDRRWRIYLLRFNETTRDNGLNNTTDKDRDGIIDGDEIDRYKTNPFYNDTDNDGILDRTQNLTETNPNVYWVEAEDLVTNQSLIVNDTDASNSKTYNLSANTSALYPLCWSDPYLNLPKGTYKCYVRAKGITQNKYLNITILNSDYTPNKKYEFLTRKDYRWYSTSEFTTHKFIVNGSEIRMRITGDDVFVDKIMLVRVLDIEGNRTDTILGQITDPLNEDTDCDMQTDLFENIPDVIWLEGEDILDYIPYDIAELNLNSSASNSKVIMLDDDLNLLLPYALTPGIYKYYIQAANVQEEDGGSGNNSQLNLSSCSLDNNSFILQESFQWYHTDPFYVNYTPDAILTISLFNEPIYIDSIMLACVNTTDEGSTNATIGIISNPLDIDTDFDGITDFNEIFGYYATSRINNELMINGEDGNTTLYCTDSYPEEPTDSDHMYLDNINIKKDGYVRIKLVGDSFVTTNFTLNGKENQAINNVYGSISSNYTKHWIENKTDTLYLNQVRVYLDDLNNEVLFINTTTFPKVTKHVLNGNNIDITERRYLTLFKELDAGTYDIYYKMNKYGLEVDDSLKFVPDYAVIEEEGIDPLNIDSDDDNITDGYELELGTSPAMTDSDQDGIGDWIEYTGVPFEFDNSSYTFYTNPAKVDTDDDGVDDGVELCYEYFDDDPTTWTNPLDSDTDNDGRLDGEEDNDANGEVLNDLWESGGETDPNDWDTDDDTMDDYWEVFYELDPLDDSDAHSEQTGDPDEDDLWNDQEYTLDTNPNSNDTDSDTYNDNLEIENRLLFRTNITDGALKINGYKDITAGWIHFRGRLSDEGYNFSFYESVTNATNATGYNDVKSTLSKNEFVCELNDGTSIYVNMSPNEYKWLYIWEPGSDHSDENENYTLEGTCYTFNRTDTPISDWSRNPLAGYRGKEYYNGTSPLSNDTDQDKVMEWNEPYWNSDNDTDGWINAIDIDSDNDLVEDGEERRGYNTSMTYDDNVNISGYNDDIDNDGIVNILDVDSDGDMVWDGTEPLWYQDMDDDGIDNMMDNDSDNDGLWDGFYDKNQNGILDEDEFGEDLNSDGIVDILETSQINSDSDGDGLLDGDEIFNSIWWGEAEDYKTENAINVTNESYASNEISIERNSSSDEGLCEISSNLTQETFIDTYEFVDNAIYDKPSIVHVYGNIFAIAYRTTGYDGFLKTVEIDNDGNIINSIIDTFEFDTNYGVTPEIIHVYGNIYAIVYNGESTNGVLKTIEINQEGYITDTEIDSFNFESSFGQSPNIKNIYDNVYAIVYYTGVHHGSLKTVEIFNNGSIRDSVLDTFQFNTSIGYMFPKIIHIINNIYGIAHRGDNDYGIIETVEILKNGSISDAALDTLEFETSKCFEPSIVQVSSKIFAIAYRGPDNDGFLKTVEIKNNGSISNNVIDTYEFDSSNGYEPNIINICGNIYAIIYRGSGDDGIIKLIVIEDNGSITKKEINTYIFDSIDGHNPNIIHVNSNIFAVVYRGSLYHGYLKTVEFGMHRYYVKAKLDPENSNIYMNLKVENEEQTIVINNTFSGLKDKYMWYLTSEFSVNGNITLYVNASENAYIDKIMLVKTYRDNFIRSFYGDSSIKFNLSGDNFTRYLQISNTSEPRYATYATMDITGEEWGVELFEESGKKMSRFQFRSPQDRTIYLLDRADQNFDLKIYKNKDGSGSGTANIKIYDPDNILIKEIDFTGYDSESAKVHLTQDGKKGVYKIVCDSESTSTYFNINNELGKTILQVPVNGIDIKEQFSLFEPSNKKIFFYVNDTNFKIKIKGLENIGKYTVKLFDPFGIKKATKSWFYLGTDSWHELSYTPNDFQKNKIWSFIIENDRPIGGDFSLKFENLENFISTDAKNFFLPYYSNPTGGATYSDINIKNPYNKNLYILNNNGGQFNITIYKKQINSNSQGQIYIYDPEGIEIFDYTFDNNGDQSQNFYINENTKVGPYKVTILSDYKSYWDIECDLGKTIVEIPEGGINIADGLDNIFYFYLPEDIKAFTIRFKGESSGFYNATIYNPNGQRIIFENWTQTDEEVKSWHDLRIEDISQTETGKVWMFNFTNPDDIIIDFEGIPPYFSNDTNNLFAYRYPYNPEIQLENTTVWNSQNILDTSETISYLSYTLNEYLLSTTPKDDHYDVLLDFSSESCGELKISDVYIRMETFCSDPTNPDTDEDGLWDGDEARVEEADGILTKYYTDPINPDSDGDTLLDGKEIHGEDIFIYSLMGDGYIQHVNSNPEKIDTDGDGISDDMEIANYVYWGEAEDFAFNPNYINPEKIVSNRSLPMFSYGDIDKDGVNDMVTVTDNNNGTYNLSWYSTADWKVRNVTTLNAEPSEIQIKDVDDNYTNEEILLRFTNSIEIISWNTSCPLWDMDNLTTNITISSDSIIRGFYIEDLYNDETQDIVIINGDQYDLVIYCWNGSNWENNESLSVLYDTYDVIVGDINHDGDNDIVVTFRDYAGQSNENDGFSIILRDEENNTWIYKNITLGVPPKSIGLGDIDTDWDTDIIIANGDANNITCFMWNETDWITEDIDVDEIISSLVISNPDNDGYNDIIGIVDNGPSNNGTMVICNKMDEEWNITKYEIDMKSPKSVFVVDINRDEDKDIIISNHSKIYQIETGQLVRDNGAHTGYALVHNTFTNVILDNTTGLYVKEGTYKYYIRARVHNEWFGKIKLTAVQGNKTLINGTEFVLNQDYKWYVTEEFNASYGLVKLNITDMTSTVLEEPIVYLDYIVLARCHDQVVTNISNESTEAQQMSIDFNSTSTKTLLINVSAEVPLYAVNAVMNLTNQTDIPLNITLDIGYRSGYWSYDGYLNGTETVEFSIPFNEYLGDSEIGAISVPLTFKGEGGILDISDISVTLKSFGTDPSNSDTDRDGLNDAEEIHFVNSDNPYVTDPANSDTDEDNLLDGTEVLGWNISCRKLNATQEVEIETILVTSDPTDVDTDDDFLSDSWEYLFTNASNSDTDGDNITDTLEHRVLFRTNAEDGFYMPDKWVAIDWDDENGLSPYINVMDLPISGPDEVIYKVLYKNLLPVQTPEGFPIARAVSSVLYFQPDPYMLDEEDPNIGEWQLRDSQVEYNFTVEEQSIIADLFYLYTDTNCNVTIYNSTYGNKEYFTRPYQLWGSKKYIEFDSPLEFYTGCTYTVELNMSKLFVSTMTRGEGDELPMNLFVLNNDLPEKAWITKELAGNYILEPYFNYNGTIVASGFIDTATWENSYDRINIIDTKHDLGEWGLSSIQTFKKDWNLEYENSTSLVESYALNNQEAWYLWTNPIDVDTDNDSLPDGFIDGWFSGKINSTYIDGNATPLEGEDLNCDGKIEYEPIEGYQLETDPQDWDSDNDWTSDGDEIYYIDPYVSNSDNDTFTGLDDWDSDQDGLIDPLDTDSDNDTFSDYYENRDHNRYFDGVLLIGEETNIHSLNFSIINETNPYDSDTDRDGIIDGVEVYNLSIDPRDIDTDGDGLPDGWIDGWFNGTLTDNTDGEVQVYEGENRNCDITWDISINETNPLNNDTDFDWVCDADELFYIGHNGTIGYNFTDPDGDGYINPVDPDSDNDGLKDGIENFDYNRVLLINESCNRTEQGEVHYLESDPYDWDCDKDGLLDGLEEQGYNDSDNDTFINIWDQDSNDGINNTRDNYWPYNNYEDTPCWDQNDDLYYDVYQMWTPTSDPTECWYTDYKETYIVFRTNAVDTDNDEELNYISGTWIFVDWNNCDLENNATTLSLEAYEWYNETSTIYSDREKLFVDYKDEIRYLNTTDNYEIYRSQTGGQDYVYIKINDNSYVTYKKYVSNPPSYNSKYSITSPNFAGKRQEKADGRPAVDPDIDSDGLPNWVETGIGTSPYDADTDNDGVLDGDELFWAINSDDDDQFYNGYINSNNYKSINALDPDADNDGIIDGIEMGITELHPHTLVNNQGPIGSAPWEYPILYTDGGGSHDPDADPSTTTNMIDPDTDGDGIYDGWHDDDHDGVYDSGEETNGEDKNADGKLANDYSETDANDTDTDNDGLTDGEEDTDCDGSYEPDRNEAGFYLELNPNDADTDDDGIKDGEEKGWNENFDNDNLMNARDDDSDDDGIQDGTEIGLTNDDKIDGLTGYYYGTSSSFVPDADGGNTVTDLFDDDTDDDGISDGDEDSNANGKQDDATESDPTMEDTDGDGLDDGEEDPNFDGIVDEDETDPADQDSDDDGINDGEEKNIYKTEPLNPDTDNDGLEDGVEIGRTSGIKSHNSWPFYKGTALNYKGDKDASTTTKPTIKDTDNDGLLDGEEDFNKDGAVGSNEPDPNLKDSDGDGINDKEDGIQDLEFDSDKQINARDLDSDGDEIPDAIEDKNHNGKKDEGETSFVNPDTDGDGLWDGKRIGNNRAEDEFGTDPIKKDTDGDTLWDGDELQLFNLDSTANKYETDPLSQDTDGDSIDDGDEICGFIIHDNSEVKTDPTNPDTDGDGLQDGQEKDGWKITITYYDSKDNMKTKEKTVYSNPTKEASQERPNMDTDDDGIDDWAEMHPEKVFSWYTNSHDEEDVTAQFNPYVKENNPPEILDVNTKTYVKWGKKWGVPYPKGAYSEITVKIMDFPGISQVKISVLDRDKTEIFNSPKYPDKKYNDKHIRAAYQADIAISYSKDYLTDYDIRIVASDYNDHETELEQNVKGKLAGLVSAFLDLMGDILGAVLDAVMALASFLIKLIISLIEKVIDKALSPIMNAINNWQNNVNTMIDELFNDEGSRGGTRGNSLSIEGMKNFLLTALDSGALFYLIIMATTAIQAIATILAVYSGGITGALGNVAEDIVVPKLIRTICSTQSLQQIVSKSILAIVGTFDVAMFLYMVKPKDDPYWNSGLGLIFIGFGVMIPSLINSIITRTMGKFFKSDGVGLFLALVGLFFHVFLSELEGDRGFFINFLGLILASIGTALTIKTKDMGDNPFNPLRNFEEIIAFSSTIYAVYSTYKFCTEEGYFS